MAQVIRDRNKAALFGDDPNEVKKVSRDNHPYKAMVRRMDDDVRLNGGPLLEKNHWDDNKKFVINYMSWEFLGVYVTDGSGACHSGRIKLDMYLPAVRVVRSFLLELQRWDRLSGVHSPDSGYVLHPGIRFCGRGLGRTSLPTLVPAAKTWLMTRKRNQNGDLVPFDITLADTDVDEELRRWELVGERVLAFAAEGRRILNKKLRTRKARFNSETPCLLDVETAESMVLYHFRDVPWLRSELHRLLHINYESPKIPDTDRIGCIAVRTGRVFGSVTTGRCSPWLGCLSDFAFGSSHHPALMGATEFREFFAILKEGVAKFGTQWAALAARRYVFGAISGDGYVSRPDAARPKIELLLNYNTWLGNLHHVLYFLAFDVDPRVHVTKKNTDTPNGVREDVFRKFIFRVSMRNDVINIARHLERPGINDDFMSPLKRGKLAFLANMSKIKARKETQRRVLDGTEEDAVQDDGRRWAEALQKAGKVLDGHSFVSQAEEETLDSEFYDDVDSDADVATATGYDSDTDSDSESLHSDSMPSVGSGSSASVAGPASEC